MHFFRIPIAVLRFLSFTFLFFISASVTVQAQSFQTASGRQERVHDRNDGTLVFDWDAKIAVGTLLGEPVVSVQFLYKTHPESSGSVPAFLNPTTASQSISLADLPEEALLGPRLYDVKMQFDFQVGGNSNNVVSLRADVGAPGKGDGQTWSYNTPGSPAWGALFSNGGGPLWPAEAKEALKAGLKLVSARILSTKISWLDLQKWYTGPSRQDEKERLLEAEKLLEAGISRSYGYDIRKTDLKSVTPKSIDKLAQRIEKMAALPEETKIGDNHTPYQVAVETVETYRQRFNQRKARFKSTEPDVDAMPRGHLPNFDAPERSHRPLRMELLSWDKQGKKLPDAGYYVMDGDQKVAGPFESGRLVLNTYVVQVKNNNGNCSYHIFPYERPSEVSVIDSAVKVPKRRLDTSDCVVSEAGANSIALAVGTWSSVPNNCSPGLNFGRCGTVPLLTCAVYDRNLTLLEKRNAGESSEPRRNGC